MIKKGTANNFLRTILSYVGEYKAASILTPSCMIGEVIMEMVIPLLMASIIDRGVNTGDMNHIVRVGGWMLLVAAAGLLFGLGGAFFGARASTGLAKNLRRAEFEHIQRFSFANIDHFGVSGLITRLTTDVTNIQNAFQMILRIGFRAPASLLIAIAMALFISPRLTSIYLVVIVVLALFLSVLIRKASGYFRAVFSRYDDLNESVQENVTAIRVVKSFVREEYENNRFRRAVGNLYGAFVRAEKLVVSSFPVMMGSIYTCILLLSWFGAKMITVGDLTTGELMSLLAYCMTILMNLMMVSILIVMFTMSEASMNRIAEVLDEEITLKNPPQPDTVVPDGSIRFEHVSFSYSETAEKPVLDDINLEIASGETIGIIGGTGSSKSSLVNMIPRLYDVLKGTVYVGGKDVRSYDLDTLRREVAVVLQKKVLFSGSVLDNLRWGNPDATEEECVEACRLACADEFIRNLPEGYQTHIDQGGTNVSGGQRQRLCIARALLKKPKVLILDDSTSAVDTATDARIQEAFREKIPDTTRLIIAQRISSVEHADRIIVMEEGRVDGVGTHEELLKTNEIYRDVYESQIKGVGDFDKMGSQIPPESGAHPEAGRTSAPAGPGADQAGNSKSAGKTESREEVRRNG